MVLLTSSVAFADETAAPSSAETAVVAESAATSPALALDMPKHMLAPESNLYPPEANVSRALGASNVAISLAVANIIMAAVDIPFFCMGSWGGIPIGIPFHYSITNVSLARLIITAPIVNHFTYKTKMWHFYSKHKAIDIAAWTMFGLGTALGITNNFLYEIVSPFFESCGFECGFLRPAGHVIAISSMIVASLASAASLFLFAAKARICYKMAVAAQKYNQNRGVAEADSDNRRQVAIIPSVAPYMDKNRQISGGTMGIALAF